MKVYKVKTESKTSLKINIWCEHLNSLRQLVVSLGSLQEYLQTDLQMNVETLLFLDLQSDLLSSIFSPVLASFL